MTTDKDQYINDIAKIIVEGACRQMKYFIGLSFIVGWMLGFLIGFFCAK